MTNLLTPNEAANAVRTESDDPVMLMLLDQVDMYILNATGRDWSADATIFPIAKTAAAMLLTTWYDNPAQVGSMTTDSPLASGVRAALLQLEVEALKYRKSVFYGLDGAGALTLSGARVGDEVMKLVGVYLVSGDQSTKFEGVISVAGEIQQTDAGNLSENIYVVILKNPADDVIA